MLEARDRYHQRHMQNIMCETLCFDHTFKVPKCISVKGSQIYSAGLEAVNGHGEICGWWLCQTKLDTETIQVKIFVA